MRHCIPDKRWRRITECLTNTTPPLEPELRRVYDVAVGAAQDEIIQYALDLIEIPGDRDAIIAFVLSGATVEEIGQSLGISLDVLNLAAWLIIDMAEFRNKLEIRRYAEEYSENATASGKQLIKTGIIHGPTALVFHYLHGHETIDINRELIAKELLTQAYFNSRLARGNALVSEHSREAMKWANATTKALELVDSLNMAVSREDDALEAVRQRILTKTPAEAGLTAIEH